MSDTVISPNMNLPVPTVSTCPGPDWATDVNACLAAIDSHNHSTGQGVPIGVSGINIDGDLTLNNNNLKSANSVGFTALVAAVTSLLKTLQVVSKDLYYIDGDGNSVRITQGGSVTGATGTITGLPSGTASAAYSGGTFTFNSATNTKATMSVGPVAIGSTTASAKQTTISSNASMPADLTLVLPQAAGAASTILTNDGSSNTSWSPITTILAASGIGTIVTSSVQSVSCSSNTLTNITSIILTAGTWMISGGTLCLGGGSPTNMETGVCLTNHDFSGTTIGFNYFFGAIYASAGIGSTAIPSYGQVVASTTTYYLNTQLASGAGTVSGTLTAVRVA